MIVGAGKTDGAMDAGNMLKPMLARGCLLYTSRLCNLIVSALLTGEDKRSSYSLVKQNRKNIVFIVEIRNACIFHILKYKIAADLKLDVKVGKRKKFSVFNNLCQCGLFAF